MTIEQVGFEDLLMNIDSKNTKSSTTVGNTKKSTRNKKQSSTKATSDKASSKKQSNIKTSASKTSNKKESNPKTAKKNSPSKKITFSQDDMDKLCEIYDWYLLVKELDVLKTINLSDRSSKIELERDIVKEVKRVSLNIDKDVWEDFSALCTNIDQKKNEVLTQIIKNFISDHKDLV